jgi:hypothetical protein
MKPEPTKAGAAGATGRASWPLRTWAAATLRELFRPLVVVYLLLAVGVDVVRLYSYWPGLDDPMHYAGALILTWFIHRGVQHAMRHGVLPELDWFPRALAIFALVCTASVFWELAEFLSDRYLGTHAQNGLADTMSDMLIDVLGSVSFIAVWTVVRRRRSR